MENEPMGHPARQIVLACFLSWMRFKKGTMPQPVVQNYGELPVQPLDLGPGLWAMPAWR